MRRKLSIFSIFMVLFLALQLSLLAPEELEIRSPSEFLKVEDWNNQVQQNIQGVRLVESHEGLKEWELSAKDALAKIESKSWELNQAEASFFGNQNIVYDVNCGLAEFFSGTKEVYFSRSVRLKSSNNYQFTSDELFYSPKQKTLSTSSGVELYAFPYRAKKDLLKVRGQNLALNLKTNEIQISGDVLSEQMSLGRQAFKLQSESILFDSSGNQAILQGNVVIDYGEMRLSGPSAEILYDSNTKVLKSLFMKQGVRVQGESRQASSETLELDIASETLILRGKPRLIQKNDELLGEEIILKNAGKNLEIKRAKAHITSGSGSMVLDE